MNSFLRLTAKHMLEKHGNDFSHLTVIFPNKRAGLFLKQELSTLTNEPIWAPRFKSIQDLFTDLSEKTIADPIVATSTLYKVYQENLPEEERGKETIDQFYSWGEIMLSDFDDIDKHTVDAEKLFLNARELNDLTDPHFLEEEQKETLEKFFSDFSEERMTELKKRFKALWEIMPKLYRGIREAMPEGVEPYTGALMRNVIESPEIIERINPKEHYAFVGFNMLGEVESKLMSILQKRGQASFYWDYDVAYLHDRHFEAGDFIRKNIERFPNELKDVSNFNNLAHHGKMTYISAPTDSIQSRYIPEWLPKYINKEEENRTAIILCDEGMLENVLHGIPSEGEAGAPSAVNVTMGFPLISTPIYSFICNLLSLQTEGIDRKHNKLRKRYARAVANHPYAKYITEESWAKITEEDNLTAILTYLDEIITQDELVGALREQPLAVLHEESIFQAHKSLVKFQKMLSDRTIDIQMKPITMRRLLKRVLGAQSIPFHGEPATGIQVMGVLETRCLDFKNILMLNVGEGLLPKGLQENSLIPYNLRVAFGMTTAKHRMATFAYYFYRLIQRAENVTCIYNDSTAGTKRNEMSRFLRQIQAETDIPIENMRLESEQKTHKFLLGDAPKTERVMKFLEETYFVREGKTAKSLSPTAINTYLTCPMQFYFKYVAGLSDQKEDEDGIDRAKLGDIFHAAAKSIYDEECIRRTGSRTVSKDQIGLLLADNARRIQKHIDKAFEEIGGISEFDGENIIFREVVDKYLRNLLHYDQRIAPFTIKKLEEWCNLTIEIKTKDDSATIKSGGIIDRMDELENGVTRILDYKTGAYHDGDVLTSNMFNFAECKGSARYYIQTLLYGLAMMPETAGPIKPVLFYPGQARKADYDPSLSIDKEVVGDIRQGSLIEDFKHNLEEKVSEIFNPEIPFTHETKHCPTCPFCSFCQG